MKKQIIAVGTLLAMGAAAQAAPLIDVYGGGYYWQPEMTGSVNYLGNEVNMSDDLGFDDSNETVLYLGVEHAIPFVPNARIRYSKIDNDNRATLHQQIEFGGKTYAASTEVTSSYDIKMLDGTLYWSPLDNIVDLDYGLTVRNFQGDISISDGTRTESASVDQTFPLLYVGAGVSLSAGFYAKASINGVKFNGSKLVDYDAHVGWRSSFLLGAELGYRQMNLELDDVSDLNSDLEIGGPYVAVTLSF